MESFKITKNLEVICEWKKTRVAFKHEATLLRDGVELLQVKINYLNRTWERYTYESVLRKLFEKAKVAKLLNKTEYIRFAITIDRGGERDMQALKTVAMVAALGNVFGETIKDKNEWKARMLKAGLNDKGLIMPDNWDKLDEATKEARLNGAIKQLT